MVIFHRDLIFGYLCAQRYPRFNDRLNMGKNWWSHVGFEVAATRVFPHVELPFDCQEVSTFGSFGREHCLSPKSGFCRRWVVRADMCLADSERSIHFPVIYRWCVAWMCSNWVAEFKSDASLGNSKKDHTAIHSVCLNVTAQKINRIISDIHHIYNNMYVYIYTL